MVTRLWVSAVEPPAGLWGKKKKTFWMEQQVVEWISIYPVCLSCPAIFIFIYYDIIKPHRTWLLFWTSANFLSFASAQHVLLLSDHPIKGSPDFRTWPRQASTRCVPPSSKRSQKNKTSKCGFLVIQSGRRKFQIKRQPGMICLSPLCCRVKSSGRDETSLILSRRHRD